MERKDWSKVRNRLRHLPMPWDYDRTRFFRDSSQDADIHQRTLARLRDEARALSADFDPFSIETHERLGVLTPTLEYLLGLAFNETTFRPESRIETINNLLLRKGVFSVRKSLLRLCASEWHLQQYWQDHVTKSVDHFASAMEGTLSPHATGVLADMPNLGYDAALLAYHWLVLVEVPEPMPNYPRLPLDIRWADMYLRYIEPAAQEIAAFRCDLKCHPSYKAAMTGLMNAGHPFQEREVDTILGERGYQIFVPFETHKQCHGHGSEGMRRSLALEDQSWYEPMKACRQLIEDARASEGLLEEQLFDVFKERIPNERHWSNTHDALQDGFLPFPLQECPATDHAEALKADWWNEYFGEVALQWETLRIFEQSINPALDVNSTYGVLRRVEREMHAAVCDRLKASYGKTAWWDRALRPSTRTRCEEAQQGDNPAYTLETYMYLRDLSELVCDNWDLYKNHFSGAMKCDSKSKVRRWFSRLIRIRNLVAHPIRCDPTADDLDFLREGDRMVATLRARLTSG